jgi:hypothetical protein
MKHYYYSTCLAASANYSTNGVVTGTSASPQVLVSPNACSAYQSRCVNYFTYSNQLNTIKVMIDNLRSPFSAALYVIMTTITNTTALNAALNNLTQSALPALNSGAAVSANAPNAPWTPIKCNSSNTGASDCNYICTNVVNATGFDEASFNSISASTTATSNRVLQNTGGVSFSSQGVNPDAAISSSDSNVVVSVQSVPDTSFGSGLITKIMMTVIASLFAMVF